MRAIFCLPIFCFLLLPGCTGKQSGKLGVSDGHLAPCPKSPNCVSSQATDKEHRIDPLKYAGSRKKAKDNLIQIIRSMKRTKIVTEKENYIHAEFRSAIWRFVDDVEFYLVDDGETIHVRSASRIGSSDMGVNRKRVESIREKFNRLQENQ